MNLLAPITLAAALLCSTPLLAEESPAVLTVSGRATLEVPADQLQTLNERYQAAFESYAAEQGMTLRNEPENTCLCCGTEVAADDAECGECGIALI